MASTEIGRLEDWPPGRLIDQAMAYTAPRFTRQNVDEAGDALVRNANDTEALEVVNNWRSCHNFPLNTFQIGLRKQANAIADDEPLVAQRIKRLPAITHKLSRIRRLKLSELQDIGGCRAVMPTVANVRELRAYYERNKKIRHSLLTENDYISAPKSSGYRSIHLVYSYASDRKTTYNGLKVEMQLRSRLQHAWATAVETVGMFSRQYLKSSQGDKQWLRFFALMGSAIAQRERCPLVPGTPSSRHELADELRHLERSLDARKRLLAYGDAVKVVEPAIGSHFILILDAMTGTLEVRGYRSNNLAQASEEYMQLERESIGNPSTDVVLVRVESVKSLRAAYPNYYLDTRRFVRALDAAVK